MKLSFLRATRLFLILSVFALSSCGAIDAFLGEPLVDINEDGSVTMISTGEKLGATAEGIGNLLYYLIPGVGGPLAAAGVYMRKRGKKLRMEHRAERYVDVEEIVKKVVIDNEAAKLMEKKNGSGNITDNSVT